MCLHEKGLDWVDHKIDLLNFEQISPAYLAINPHGVVPTLVVDDVPIIDSSVIIEYLDETFPAPALSPADNKMRAGKVSSRVLNYDSPDPLCGFDDYIVYPAGGIYHSSEKMYRFKNTPHWLVPN